MSVALSADATTPDPHSSSHPLHVLANHSFYGQGPIVKKDAFPPWVQQLAFYRTEIHSKHTANTTGEMVGTPAITALDGYSSTGQSGQGKGGRVVLNSPHPELTTPPIPAIYAGELEWVMRRQ